MTNTPTEKSQKVEILERHVDAEMQGDLDTTMATMTDNPHLHNIAVNMGGVGFEGVKTFYKNHLVGKFFPPDVKFVTISRTEGVDQLVEEQVIQFTHTTMMDWMLPNIPPTGKYVEVALVVIVKFEGGKIAHEHVYWDQASVLVQIGLLDPKNLPVTDASAVQKLIELKIPSPAGGRGEG